MRWPQLLETIGKRCGTGGGASLMLNAHVDVVPPGDLDRWGDQMPFGGTVGADAVYGRGACDMKAGYRSAPRRNAVAWRHDWRPCRTCALPAPVMEPSAPAGEPLDRGASPRPLSSGPSEAFNRVTRVPPRGACGSSRPMASPEVHDLIRPWPETASVSSRECWPSTPWPGTAQKLSGFSGMKTPSLLQ